MDNLGFTMAGIVPMPWMNDEFIVLQINGLLLDTNSKQAICLSKPLMNQFRDENINVLAQYCGNSSAIAMELL